MISLNALLAECGILFELEKALDNLNIPDTTIKQLQQDIAILITNAVVNSGISVVEDFER